MTAKLTRLTHKIAMQLHLVAESCTICSSRSRRPVRKPLDTPSYVNITAGRVPQFTHPWSKCTGDFKCDLWHLPNMLQFFMEAEFVISSNKKSPQNLQVVVFCVNISCSDVKGYQRFGGPSCLHLQIFTINYAKLHPSLGLDCMVSTITRLWAGRPMLNSRRSKERIFLCAAESRPASNQMGNERGGVGGSLSPEVNHEADHSLPSRAEVKMLGATIPHTHTSSRRAYYLHGLVTR
jgi:hypothetical protein